MVYAYLNFSFVNYYLNKTIPQVITKQGIVKHSKFFGINSFAAKSNTCQYNDPLRA